MSEELGRIERPPVEKFAGARKLIVVPLIFCGKDAPPDFVEIYNRCWNEIGRQLERLQSKLGRITRIYHEMVHAGGAEGMVLVQQLNPDSHSLIQSLSPDGVQLQAFEDMELAAETMDWERCLMVTVGEKARWKVLELHAEASSKRFAYMATRIGETLPPGEAGVLFIREGHRIQFPKDLEVLTVYPPAMDEIHRWLRDYDVRAKHGPAEESPSEQA